MHVRPAPLIALTAILFLGAAAAHPLARPPLASACSGPGPSWSWPSQEFIVEGRVMSIASLPGDPDSALPWTLPYAMTIEVAKSYRGSLAPGIYEVVAYLPGFAPGCPGGGLKDELVGLEVMVGLNSEDGHLVSRFSGETIGLDDDKGVSRLRRLATLLGDSDPALPRLVLDPPSPVCGQVVSVRGTNFPQGRYVIQVESQSPLAAASPDLAGSFVLSFPLDPGPCRSPDWEGKWVRLTATPAGSDQDFIAPAEIVPFRVAGAAAAAPQEFNVRPVLAECGDTVTVSGAGFRAFESLALEGPGVGQRLELAATSEGTLEVFVRLPLECGSKLPGTQRATTTIRLLQRLPGDLGDWPVATLSVGLFEPSSASSETAPQAQQPPASSLQPEPSPPGQLSERTATRGREPSPFAVALAGLGFALVITCLVLALRLRQVSR